MADFAQDLQYIRASSSFPFLDIDPNIEQINNNLSVLDNTSLLNYQSFMPFSNPDNFFEFPGNLAENFPGNSLQNNMLPVCHTVTSTECESKNRKAVEISESSNEDSTPVSEIENNKRKKVSSSYFLKLSFFSSFSRTWFLIFYLMGCLLFWVFRIQGEEREWKAMRKKKRNQRKWFMLELEEDKLRIVTV